MERSAGPRNSASIPGVAAIASTLSRAVCVSIMAKRQGELVGLTQVDLLVRHVGESGDAMRTPAAFAHRREFGKRDIGARVCGCVDHRRDNSLSPEVERTARSRKLPHGNPHDRRRAAVADLRDCRHHRCDIPQAVLRIQGDGRKSLAPDELGHDRTSQATPSAVHGFACAQPASEREGGGWHGSASRLGGAGGHRHD